MRYHAKAIGAGSEGAQSELQDSYDKVRLFARALRSYWSFARRPLADDGLFTHPAVLEPHSR